MKSALFALIVLFVIVWAIVWYSTRGKCCIREGYNMTVFDPSTRSGLRDIGPNVYVPKEENLLEEEEEEAPTCGACS